MQTQPALTHEVLSLLVEQSGDGIIVVDAKGAIRIFNPEAERQHGVGLVGIQSESWASAYGLRRMDGSPLPREETPLFRALHGERVTDAQWKVRRPDGTEVVITGTATPLRKPDGTSLGAMIITRDESARQARAESLRDQEAARLSAILEKLPVGVMIAEAPSGRTTYTNPRAAEIFAGPIRADSTPDYARRFTAWHRDGTPFRSEDFPLVKALLGQSVQGVEVKFRRASGDAAVVRANAAPIRDATGAVVAAVTAYVDVTEEVRLFDEAVAARAVAESASRAKDVFLAMLGHELRNPLAPIVTALQLMRSRGDATFERERSIIEKQVKHLSQLVDDLLDASRITRGTLKLVKSPVALDEVLARAVEAVKPALEQRGQHLELDSASERVHVDGEVDRLAQVFSNLLSNAARFTPAGGHIALRSRLVGGEVHVTVTDDGEGISAALLPQVFDLFTQAAQNLDRTAGGIGVGLTIVKSLVELHGGSVSARSPGPGQGSTFEVRLPVLEAARTQRPLPGPSPGPAPVRAATQGPRVLVVDDHEDNAALIAEYLQTLGFEVRTANDGPGALRVVRTFPAMLALLDIGLPGMDGFELAAQLQAVHPELILLALSGYGQDGDRKRSAEAGFAHHLVKPVDLDQLARLLRELAAKAR